MKYSKYLAAISLFALLTVGAFAADKNQGKITISQAATVAGTQLAPGSYKLQWEGTGPEVQVKFLRDGKAVVTAPAKLVSKETLPPYDSVILKPSGAESRAIEEINFRNQKQALSFSSNQTSTGN